MRVMMAMVMIAARAVCRCRRRSQGELGAMAVLVFMLAATGYSLLVAVMRDGLVGFGHAAPVPWISNREGR